MKDKQKCSSIDGHLEIETHYGVKIKAAWAQTVEVQALDEIRALWARRLEIHSIMLDSLASVRAGQASDTAAIETIMRGIKSAEDALWQTGLAILAICAVPPDGVEWARVFDAPSDGIVSAVSLAVSQYGLSDAEVAWIESRGCQRCGLPDPHPSQLPSGICECAQLHPDSACPLIDSPAAPSPKAGLVWTDWLMRREFAREPQNWTLAHTDGFRILDRIAAESEFLSVQKQIEMVKHARDD